METIAVYWEPVIRVYGFESLKSVAFAELVFTEDQLEQCGNILESFTDSSIGFRFVLLQVVESNTYRLSIGVKNEFAEKLLQHLEQFSYVGSDISVQVKQPIDILFFHGPHFQDRYGIAEKAFRAINRDTISLHAAGCCGTSIYLVVGDGEAKLVQNMLASDFIVPGQEEHNN